MTVQSSERIYYVDENDTPTGEVEDKLTAHHANTKLHAAFSCYIFNDKQQFLVTKRADTKKVWSGFWTNSCCGHPMPEETREAALQRRVMFELGLKVTNIEVLNPTYIYKTPPYNNIIEHEYCPIYSAFTTTDPKMNPDEVSAWEWISWDEYSSRIKADASNYELTNQQETPAWSWWCKDQFTGIDTKVRELLRLQGRR